MKTLDRYIVRNFLVSAVLCLIAIMLLRVAADLFFNIDEFAESGAKKKDFAVIVGEILTYYAFQSLLYFRQLGGVIVVLAATFTLWRMNHTNELTAVLASGVSLYRVLLPIVLCAIGLNVLVIVDTELLIPPVKHRMVRSRDDVTGAGAFRVYVIVDVKNSAWYSKEFDPTQGRLASPLLILRDERLTYVGYITGPSAVYDRSVAGWIFAPGPPPRPKDEPVHAVMKIKGWLESPTTGYVPTRLGPDAIIEHARADPDNEGVNWRRVKGIRGVEIEDPSVGLAVRDERGNNVLVLTIRAARLALKVTGDRVAGTVLQDVRFIYSRKDGERVACFSAPEATYDSDARRWVLADGRLVYSCDLDPSALSLRQSGDWLEYMSTAELTRLLRLQRVPNAEGATLVRYIRFADFFNNIIMLLVAVPFILSRERNIKVSAGLALLMVGGTFAFIYVSRYLGLSPIVAAWMPIIVVGPISAVMLDSIKT